MTQKIQKFYRVSEVVQLLGVSQTTVYRMVTEGRLTLVKVGKRASAVPADSLREFMDKASTSADVPQGAEAVREIWEYSFIHSSATGRGDSKVGPCLTYDKQQAFGVGCIEQRRIDLPAAPPAQTALAEDARDAIRREAFDEACAAIKAEDDRQSSNDYMLDSDDCIAVIRALTAAQSASGDKS